MNTKVSFRTFLCPRLQVGTSVHIGNVDNEARPLYRQGHLELIAGF
jgi:hypothetical protein